MSTKAERKAAAALLGSATTPKKAAAARENGKRGGAPRLCTCGHKRGLHYRYAADGAFVETFGACSDGECKCEEYKARD